jgi:putative ABC transport system ATP-binding protein
MSPLLIGHELHKSYGLTPALRGASIAVNEGEIVAVMGPSGCGKSTLLHCLAGVLPPDAGEVHFNGERIDNASDRRRVRLRRSAFGLVYQFGQLVPELPAVENIALPLLLAGRRRRECLAQAGEWLTRMGLDGLGDRLPGELSGGQGQRIALARALIARPRVVFADEPTGSLDSVAADEVMELLVETARTQGTSVLVVTHEPRVAGFADRTVLMRDGVESVPANGANAKPPGGGASLRVSPGDAEPSADVIPSFGRRGGRTTS